MRTCIGCASPAESETAPPSKLRRGSMTWCTQCLDAFMELAVEGAGAP